MENGVPPTGPWVLDGSGSAGQGSKMMSEDEKEKNSAASINPYTAPTTGVGASAMTDTSMDILPYRAVCPVCKERISRRGCLAKTITCPKCTAELKQNGQWNWTGNVIFGSLTGFFWVFGGFLGVMCLEDLLYRPYVGNLLTVALLISGPMLAVAFFPYVSKYDDPRMDPRKVRGLKSDQTV